MKKKFLYLGMALALSVSAVNMPYAFGQAYASVIREPDDGEAYDAQADGMEDEDDEIYAGELTKYDIKAAPSKKTIHVKESFKIRVLAQAESEWADLPDEEWEELCEQSIDSISYRSTKSSVASVSSSGKVTGRRKGTAGIKTTIDLANGETVVYKTKVYVKKEKVSEGGSYKPEATIPPVDEELIDE